jgi:hypothetical protein
MQFDKQQVIQALESMGNHQQAQQAQSQLPDRVDTDQHAGLLSNLGADVPQLIQQITGGTL